MLGLELVAVNGGHGGVISSSLLAGVGNGHSVVLFEACETVGHIALDGALKSRWTKKGHVDQERNSKVYCSAYRFDSISDTDGPWRHIVYGHVDQG